MIENVVPLLASLSHERNIWRLLDVSPLTITSLTGDSAGDQILAHDVRLFYLSVAEHSSRLGNFLWAQPPSASHFD